MKKRLKGLLAVALSMAFVLTAMPLSGFAAEQTLYLSEGKLYDSTDAEFTGTLDIGDKITAKDGNAFYAVVNGEKDSTAANYGSESYEGKKEASETSEASGSTYYNDYTVPAAPEGYKAPAAAEVEASGEYYFVSEGSQAFSGSVLKLEFTPVEYQLEFDLDGGKLAENLELETATVKYGTEFNLPSEAEVTKEGFVLSGWKNGEKTYSAGEKVKNLSSTDGEKVTLTAVWTEEKEDEPSAEKFTITYYSENEQYGEVQTYSSGDGIILPAAPVKEGYVFEGWVIDDNHTKLPEIMPAENLKAYASWRLASIKIHYFDGETEVSSTTALYGSDIGLTVPEDLTKEGYTFAGWFDGEGSNVYSYETVPAEDLTFTAKWLKNGNVTYYVDDKTYEAYEVTEGDKIPVPEDPEKFGKKFVGWDPEVPEVMPGEDLSFNAVFETDKEFVSVIVGGTVIAGGVIAAIAGAGAAAITGISIIGGILALIGGVSLISKTYTATYKVDDTVYKTYKVEAGNAIPVPADPEKEGYVFAGWNPSVPEKMPKADQTFEATWKEVDSDKDDSNVNIEIPSTGSTAAGIAALATLSISAAAFIILSKKKKNK